MPEFPLRDQTVLLTGATGVLGSVLRQKLAPRCRLVTLQRRSPAPNGEPAGETLAGDLTRPRLGLSDPDWSRLAGRLDAIIHLAALTSFNGKPEAYQRANVDGTARIVELARASGAKLLFVSTSFVHGEERTPSGEAPRTYAISKLDAEALVEASGLRYLIARPSTIIGDRDSGFMPSLQGFHLVLLLLLQNELPILPTESGSRLDFLPRDLLAEALVTLLELGLPVRECWLTVGEGAPTVEHLMETGSDYLRRALRREIRTPRMVPMEMFDRLIRPVFFPSLPGRMRGMFERVLPVCRTMARPHLFPSSLEAMGATLGRTLRFDPDAVFLRNIDHLAARYPALREARS